VIREATGEDLLADLKRAIEEANRVVFERSRSHPDLSGMGTTCTAVIVRGDRAWIGHVGDSRAYLIRGDVIRQLTKDHSLVAYLVERRELTQEQARKDPRRNVVTRSVGPSEEVEVDTLVSDTTLRPGDTVLVCSDGLHGPITDADLADVVASEDFLTVSDRLVAEANDRGGPDNITVIVVRMGAEENVGDADEAAPADQKVAAAFAVHPLLLILFAATLVLACVLWFLNRQASAL
jgi:protein phosphatase